MGCLDSQKTEHESWTRVQIGRRYRPRGIDYALKLTNLLTDIKY